LVQKLRVSVAEPKLVA